MSDDGLRPDGRREMSELIYAVTCLRAGRIHMVSTTKMLHLYEFFLSAGEHKHAGMAAEIADQTVREAIDGRV